MKEISEKERNADVFVFLSPSPNNECQWYINQISIGRTYTVVVWFRLTHPACPWKCTVGDPKGVSSEVNY